MPFFASLIAPGFTAEAHAELVTVSRIMLLSPILLGMSNLFGTITQLFKKFFVYALSPIFYNLGIIIGIVVLYPIFGVYGLAAGVVLGAMLHLSIQLIVVLNSKYVPRISRKINYTRIKQVTFLSLPRTLTLSLTNIIFMVMISLASNISEGAISIFSFSYNLQSVPLGLIGISYSVAAFPALVAAYTSKDYNLFSRQVIDACRQIIFWSLPIIFLFIVLRAQIVRVILGSGRFSWADTKLTAAALGIFAVSILAQCLILILIRGYYAAGNTKKPLFINIFSAGLTVAIGYYLVYAFQNIESFRSFIKAFLRVEDIPNGAILMLPLAFSIGNIVNFIILWISFKRDLLKGTGFSFQTTFIKSLTASFLIGLTSYISLSFFGLFFDLDSFYGVFFQGLFSGVIGILVGGLFLWLIRSAEFERILSAFIRRLNRDKGTVLEQTHL